MKITSLSIAVIAFAPVAFTRCAWAGTMNCLSAAIMAEKEQDLPFGLLNAIGEVESGGNPLAINVDGTAYAPANAVAATAEVQAAAARGAHFIDVGCFQVDLRWHPGAFADLADAFDPLRNARAAASFLASLRRLATSWGAAVARYHSAAAGEGASYAGRVLARWRSDPFAPMTAAGTDAASPPARTNSARALPHLFAFGMRVTGPGEAASTVLRGLPIVVTP